MLVTLSVSTIPLSLEASMSGSVGCGGSVMSIVTTSSSD